MIQRPLSIRASITQTTVQCKEASIFSTYFNGLCSVSELELEAKTWCSCTVCMNTAFRPGSVSFIQGTAFFTNLRQFHRCHQSHHCHQFYQFRAEIDNRCKNWWNRWKAVKIGDIGEKSGSLDRHGVSTLPWDCSLGQCPRKITGMEFAVCYADSMFTHTNQK